MSKIYKVKQKMPDGKYRYYSGSTKEEAEAKRDADKILMGKGIDVVDKTTFRTLADTWFKLTKEADKSLHIRTLETIQGILNRQVFPVLGDMKVRDIKPVHIQALMYSVRDKSHSTQSKVFNYTRAIMMLAVDNNLIEKIPFTSTMKPGGEKPKEVKPLTNEQMEKLLDATKDTRVYPFLVVLRFLGLRKGEALGLMWSDIDFVNNTVTVNRSIVYPKDQREGVINPECKTSAAHRTIPMIPMVRSVLQAEKAKSKSLYVFSMKNGKYLSESSFKKMWELIKYRTVGTESSRVITERTIDFDVHPHQLRHTCITEWIRNGVKPKTAQYLAGHSTMDMTMEVYSHYQEEIERKETAALLAGAAPRFASV